MEREKYGELFRELRRSLGITQQQLADGICSVRHIKNIENGSNSPSVELISYFSKKLGNRVYELTELSKTGICISHYTVINKMKRYYKAHQFQKLWNLITKYEEQLLMYDNSYITQIIKWYKGICYGALEKSYKKCRKELLSAWSISNSSSSIEIQLKHLTKTEIHIFNSIASNEYMYGYYNTALAMYLELYDYLTTTKIDGSECEDLVTRLSYNIAKCYNALKDYTTAIQYCSIAIKNGQENFNADMLAEAYYEQGYSYLQLNQLELAKKLFKKSIYLYEIMGLDEQIAGTKEELEQKYGMKFDVLV